ncbi:helix-turn-helix domain-containing protein [Halegenticoccus tardaugens]|uniref:helix-turn-helix domain-containing protein n=1 Tax=Halegenticoccus tardaugens TaxID=2071624 RepID=UPI00100B4C04|nr:helix-turn-helix domain-containing protein [Halegenticoccus tardaugens]
MSVIVEFEIKPAQFLLADILTELPEAWAQFERVVPSGERPVPLLWVYGADPETSEHHLSSHPMIHNIKQVEASEEQALYAVEWAEEPDSVLEGIAKQDADILDAAGSADRWRFELRFPSHKALSAFKAHCDDTGVHMTPIRISHTTETDLSFRYGLTERQFETLVYAAEAGYFDVPRQRSMDEVGDHFGISGQAASERVRRGIKTFVMNVLVEAGG